MSSVGQLAMSSSNVTVVPLMTTRHSTPERVSPAVRPHPHPPEPDAVVTVASPIQLALITVDPDVGDCDDSSRGPVTSDPESLHAVSVRRTRGTNTRIISASQVEISVYSS